MTIDLNTITLAAGGHDSPEWLREQREGHQ